MTTVIEKGVVIRAVDDNLAYAVSHGLNPRSVAFGPSAVPAFGGESLPDLGIIEGASVTLTIDETTGHVEQVTLNPAGRARGGKNVTSIEEEASLPRAFPARITGANHLELLPSDAAAAPVFVPRAVPPETRKFGKLIDTSMLKPGDLLLSRDLAPEWTGRAIVSVQKDGGYADIDARWTHAAMYVGDGAHIVEATFDSPSTGGSVRLTSLDDYCKGEAAVRFRRSRFLSTDEERWKLCVRALARLHRPYNFAKAIEMWFKVALAGRGFYDDKVRYQTSEAVVCSTLYADAYNETLRRSLGEICGACVPAWLSVSDEFSDVETRWLSF